MKSFVQVSLLSITLLGGMFSLMGGPLGLLRKKGKPSAQPSSNPSSQKSTNAQPETISTKPEVSPQPQPLSPQNNAPTTSTTTRAEELRSLEIKNIRISKAKTKIEAMNDNSDLRDIKDSVNSAAGDMINLYRNNSTPDDEKLKETRKQVERSARELVGQVLRKILQKPSLMDSLIEGAFTQLNTIDGTPEYNQAIDTFLGTLSSRVINTKNVDAIASFTQIVLEKSKALRDPERRSAAQKDFLEMISSKVVNILNNEEMNFEDRVPLFFEINEALAQNKGLEELDFSDKSEFFNKLKEAQDNIFKKDFTENYGTGKGIQKAYNNLPETYKDSFSEDFQNALMDMVRERNIPARAIQILNGAKAIIPENKRDAFFTDLVKQIEKNMSTDTSEAAVDIGLAQLSGLQRASGDSSSDFKQLIEKSLTEVKLKNIPNDAAQNLATTLQNYQQKISEHKSWSLADAFKNTLKKIGDVFNAEKKANQQRIDSILREKPAKRLKDIQEFVRNEGGATSVSSINYDAVADLLKGLDKKTAVNDRTQLIDEAITTLINAAPYNMETRVSIFEKLLKAVKTGGALTQEDMPLVNSIQTAFEKHMTDTMLNSLNDHFSRRAQSGMSSIIGETTSNTSEPTQQDANRALAAQGNDILTTSSKARAAGQQNAVDGRSETTASINDRGNSANTQSGEVPRQPNNSSADPTLTNTSDDEPTQESGKSGEGTDETNEQREQEEQGSTKNNESGSNEGKSTNLEADQGVVEAAR